MNGSPDPLLAWRREFPILETCTYLISNSLGAMPRGVYDNLRAYADAWATQGVSAWGKGWWDLSGQVGDRVGAVIGAPPGTTMIEQNASIANSILFSGLDFSDTRRNRVVISDMDFPGDVYSLRPWLPPHIELYVVRTRDGITLPTDELLGAINERTCLVSLSHVLFRSAYIVPAADIVARAHAVGAQVALNGYHSAGILPVNVTALDVDYYVGGVLKWMCGGPGGVFLYARPDRLPALRPKVTGWFAHPQPFSFDLEPFEPRNDAYRMATGTPGVASLYAIQPGIDVITRVGVEAIRAKSMRQTALLIALADAQGWDVISPRRAEERAGTVTVRPPEAYAVSRELIARGLIVDYRQGAGIRIAPHFYNSDDEVRAVITAIAAILEDGSWQRHAEGRAFVT